MRQPDDLVQVVIRFANFITTHTAAVTRKRRCAFYQDFLGLPLTEAFEINETKSGQKTQVLHSFYQLDDGSYLAFFEAPDMPFEFKVQHDFDLHIALEVANDVLRGNDSKRAFAGMTTIEVRPRGGAA